MDLDLPPGLTSRPAKKADIPAIVELIGACELDSDGVAEVDESDVSFDRHGFDPDLDTVLVFDREELVAWAEVYRGRAEADVRPTHRDGGIGSALLRWTEDRARDGGGDEVNQSKTDANESARELFLSNGYEQRWIAWFIRIALADAPPPQAPPAGITIRPYRDTDARDVHRVMDAAFTEWPGREPEPYEVWASIVLAHPAFQPELSPLAFDGDGLVGVIITNDYPEAAEAWIHQLATKATHRHRGIAQALLRTAFSWYRERGRTSAGVSTDSRTGALGLYEKVGMKVVRQYTRYTKRLS